MEAPAREALRWCAVRAPLTLCLLLVAAACRATPSPLAAAEPDLPYALVLGTAQDGGLPQLGCRDAACTASRTDHARRRLVTSLLVADPRSGKRWLFDASPDIAEQVELARGHPRNHESERSAGGSRPALFDGVFLTHAHIGHYSGLLQLGREVYGARGLPVHASARMSAFLASNGPWSLLVDTGAIELRELRPGRPVRLADDLTVEAWTVPHRDEFSDTLAFVIRGPRRALLYLPDIDKWERWDRPLAGALRSVDVALVDGTFHEGGELPGRSMADIPHPFIVETLALARDLPAAERAKLRFTHLNHSNPAADPTGPAAAAVRAAGLAIAADGERHDL
jgi:pyrroloquinoline quinone biosynthesis protein B